MFGYEDLEREYASAWDEWELCGAQVLWEAVTGDGLTKPDDAAPSPLPDARDRN